MRRRTLPVTTTRADARRTYDRISGVYDRTEGLFEHAAISRAVRAAQVKQGEHVLEIGPGTGYALDQLTAAAGPSGAIVALDLSRRMLEQIRRRGRAPSAGLVLGDATALPLASGRFDLAFMSFVLELLPSDDIDTALAEVRRVLKPGGRLVNLSLSRERLNLFTRLYERGHTLFPRLLDCRPIYADECAGDAGLDVVETQSIGIWGLSAAIVVARKPEST